MIDGENVFHAETVIYTEKQNRNHNAFVFVRARNCKFVYLFRFNWLFSVEVRNCLFEHDVIDAKALAEENGRLTMTNNGTGNCVVYLLNPLREEIIYLDDFWTDSVFHPIEIYNNNESVLNFTKFNKPDKFVLQDNFYRIVVPVGASFTVVGHYNGVN